MSDLLQGKNVLITGAGRNIGRSIAMEMAAQGACIFFTNIDQEFCKQLQRELIVRSPNSAGFVSDITHPGEVEMLCEALQKNRIHIDILINNLGVELESQKGGILDLEIWRHIFETNLLGPIYLTKIISEDMIKMRIQGSILFISSIHQWCLRRLPGYSSSKAAIGMLVKELAIELAPRNIRVNGIAPGYVAEDKRGDPIGHRYTPLRRGSINPCYIGRAAVYLSSDYFSMCTTGSTLKIDAGLSLFNHLLAS